MEGFLLKELLGRGAFAQVYLAEQIGLSNRLVALKLTRRLGKEAGRLARLQHANIVPIFSFHPGREWQAICMPYFGRQTLDDIVRTIRESRQIPKSGCEVFSTIAAQGESTIRSTQTSTATPNVEPVRPSDAGSHGELRHVLAHLSYPDAAVLLVAQMADGLAHAHSLGIWHLDLKPANVLVSDHGQPMLLDFNLAFDTEREDRQRFGGTVAYMAPEQLDEMIESRKRHKSGSQSVGPRVSKVDHRTDLFALGVILYELLTGRHPFPTTKSNEDPFQAARRSRLATRPTARQLNSSISAGIDAIIERLLSIRMQDRYPSAVALRQDLIGHLEHKPLVYVREPRLAERFAKWRMRHPKALAKLVAAIAVSTAVAATGWGTRQWQHSLNVAARDRIADFRAGLAPLRIDLAAHDETSTLRRGLDRATGLFDSLGLDQNSDARFNPTIARLAPSERDAALADLGEVAALASFAVRAERKGDTLSTVDSRVKKWQAITVLCFHGQSVPAILGGNDTGVRSDFLTATMALREGRVADAARLFDRVVKADPQHAAAHFLYAIALRDQYQLTRASERFEMAAALSPSDARPAYNRGLILLSDRKYAAAEAAFTDALHRDPKMGEALLHRATSRWHLSRPEEALADCDAALATSKSVRLFVLRSGIHKSLGNKDAAAKDAETARSISPVAAEDYATRGALRSKANDHTGALADFRTASTLSPRYFQAWNNQAYELGEHLHETDLAIAAMDKAVEANAQSGELRLGRAVLLARIGKRDAAIADAEKGLLQADNPKQTYQAACVFALTSKTKPEDADRAVEFLRQAYRDGYHELHVYATDPDLNPIRHRDDVKRILEAVSSLTR